MLEFSYLDFFPDTFGVEPARFLVMDRDGRSKLIEPDEVADLAEPILTFECPRLVEEFRRLGILPPPELFDIGVALREISATPRDEGGERKWDTWRALRPHFENASAFAEFRGIFRGSIGRAEDDNNPEKLLTSAARALADLWAGVGKELEEAGEIDRFFNIECPIQPVFHHRQFNGITVDQTQLSDFVEAAKDEKYTAYIALAETTGVSPSGMTYRNVGRLLENTDGSHLSHLVGRDRLEDYFELAASKSRFASTFVQYRKADRDIDALSRLSAQTGRVHPIFQSFGTVTGRILVADPYLQQLRRKYRSVIQADDGMELVYLDYSQFEPGIVASFSGDPHLIEDYNTSDVYTSLSNRIFGTDQERDLCKKIFLAFTYGMDLQNISILLAGPDATESDVSDYSTRVESFFNRYQKFLEYRISLQNSLLQNGYICTPLGNRRVRSSSGELSRREKRWAVSQMIQGTASLIFKEAVLAIFDNIRDGEIILPMHDAVLMQFRADATEELANGVAELMCAAFTHRCEQIVPQVSIGSFSVE